MLRVVTQADQVEEQENPEDTLARLGSRLGEWGAAAAAKMPMTDSGLQRQ